MTTRRIDTGENYKVVELGERATARDLDEWYKRGWKLIGYAEADMDNCRYIFIKEEDLK